MGVSVYVRGLCVREFECFKMAGNCTGQILDTYWISTLCYRGIHKPFSHCAFRTTAVMFILGRLLLSYHR